MNLSEFLKESCGPMLFEAFQNKDLQKAISLTRAYLRKHNFEVWSMGLDFTISGNDSICVPVYNSKTSRGALMVWTRGEETSGIHSIVFTENLNDVLMAYVTGESAKGIEVETKGANTIQCIKLIEAVLSAEVDMNGGDIKKWIRGSQLYEGTEDIPASVNEDAVADIQRRRHNVGQRLGKVRRAGGDITELQRQYDELTAEWNEAKAVINPGATIEKSEPASLSKWEEYLAQQEKATPEERFEDMNAYVTSVILSRRPLALLCGAPGVGKTFRVLKNIKSAGLVMNKDYFLLKGKCTPTALFKALHDYKDKGKVVLFDDCDSIFKDEDAINLLKAAYDSSDERWVSWNTSAAIPMDEELAQECDDAVWNDAKSRWEYPKQFLYQGGGVVITNWRAGQIDTAIRNRALICDLDFSIKEVLELVESIIPHLDCEESSAKKALDFLYKLADLEAPLEISIRSFLICSGQYSSGAPDKVCERRIIEQMKNLSAHGGKKY